MQIHRMRPTRYGAWWPWIVVSLGLAGCAASAQSQRYDALAAELHATSAGAGARSAAEERPLTDLPRLERDVLVRVVLARNPSIESAREAWRGALARYPQATALDDPMVEYSLAPLSIGSDDASFGQVIRVGQRFPWPGKLDLAGEVALAEAEGARAGYEATRLRLALMASLLFDQYYVVERSLDINAEHRRLIEDIKAIAEAQYAAGRAPQQEPLQAEVELAHILHQRVGLEAQRNTVVAQINGLLHQRPNQPLPPPPEHLDPGMPGTPGMEDIASSEALQEQALQQRPELRASDAQVQGRRSAVALAKRQYYPDFGVMASYNSMWMGIEHQVMVGLSLELPVQRGARRGALEEAEARLLQARAEQATSTDEIQVEVEQARQHVLEAAHVVRLYQARLLPAARAQIEAARVGYETGRSSFQALIDAERSLRSLELDYQVALARLARRHAELQRAIGDIPGLSNGPGLTNGSIDQEDTP